VTLYRLTGRTTAYGQESGKGLLNKPRPGQKMAR
jgi:hypothetical protein